MREMRRNSGHANARNRGVLPLAVVVLSVLTFVASILLVISVPTYADSVHAAKLGENDVDDTQSSLLDAPADEAEDGPKQTDLESSDAPEAILKEEFISDDGAQTRKDGTDDAVATESTPPSPSDDETGDERPTPRSGFRRARAVAADACLSGDIFSVSAEGTIYKVDKRGRKTHVVDVPNANPHWGYTAVNALGVGQDAEVLYAIRHWKVQGQWWYVILRYTVSTGEWYEVTRVNQAPTSQLFVAGAVQLSTNDYYIGAFDAHESRSRKVYFHLWKYSVRENDFVRLGWFDTGELLGRDGDYSAVANGDMAFDEEGNLFVVRSGSGTANIYSISADDLARERDGLRVAQDSGRVTTTAAVNGIAFDAEGRMFLGDRRKITGHDPLDLQQLERRTTSLDESTDLATCESPATIRVMKNIVGRAKANDQFDLQLALYKDGRPSKSIPSVRTKGDRVGLQTESIGVFPAKTGSTFVFSEAIAPGSGGNLNDYNARWQCKANGRQIAEGVGKRGEVVIPQQPSVKVECTITNTPLSGSLVWEKVDSEERNTRLAGSVWTISGPLARGRSGTVKDCVAANANQCRAEDNDTDPRAGYFKVDNLYLGRYTLRETTPPSGYEGTTQTFTQTLDADKQQRSFGKIDNKKLVAQIQVTKEVRDPSGGKVANASGWTMSVDLATRLNGTLSPLKDRNNPWFGKHQVSDASGAVPEQWTVAFPNSTSTQDIRITEAPKPSSYQASIRCTSNKRQPVEAAGNGLNIAAVTPGEKFLCVVTNKQLPGSVVWEKTDASGTYLSGSEWSVTTTQQGVITVKDCVRAGACQNGGDRDPRPGRFRLEGLKWQEVTLEETAAPPGYRRNTEVLRRTIGENALQANFGRITNETVTLPLLPLTGGMGADSFLMAGAGILILAVGAALMRRLQLAGVSSLATQSLYGDKTERG